MKKTLTRSAILTSAMIALSTCFSSITSASVYAENTYNVKDIYYNEVTIEEGSFLFTLTEFSDPIASYSEDGAVSSSKTVTQVRVTPITEEYYEEIYDDLLVRPLSGSDSKTRYTVDTSLSYNMYLTVTFDVKDFDGCTGVRVGDVEGGYYGYNGSGTAIGSGVSVSAQKVYVGNVGACADMVSGNWINRTKTYRPSASKTDWSYSLPSTWEYVDVTSQIGVTSTVGATYTTTGKRGTSTWDTSLQVNY